MRWARGDGRSWFIYKISINRADNNSAYFVIQYFCCRPILALCHLSLFLKVLGPSIFHLQTCVSFTQDSRSKGVF